MHGPLPRLVVTDMVRERAGKALGTAGVEGLVELYTRDTALGRPVTIEEVAALAVHISSDAGAGITGANLSIDGGAAFF